MKDSVAQPVEHNTFNVGVLGSSPSWITEESENDYLEMIKPENYLVLRLFFFSKRQNRPLFRAHVSRLMSDTETCFVFAPQWKVMETVIILLRFSCYYPCLNIRS